MQKNNNNETNMPGYCEYLVDGFASKKIIMLRVISVVVALLLCVVLFKLLSVIPGVIFIWGIIVLFFLVMMFRLTSREFEYTVSHGEFTVDIIYGKKRRKNLITVKISDISKVFPVTGVKDAKISELNASRVMYTCSPKARELYCMYANDTAIVFSSCTKLNDSIKYFNRHVF